MIKIISDMKAPSGIEQIILDCTELPLILDDSTSPVPYLDTVAIHVAALIDGDLQVKDTSARTS